MIVLAVVVEILLHESEVHQGWDSWDLDGYGGVNALKVSHTIISLYF